MQEAVQARALRTEQTKNSFQLKSSSDQIPAGTRWTVGGRKNAFGGGTAGAGAGEASANTVARDVMHTRIHLDGAYAMIWCHCVEVGRLVGVETLLRLRVMLSFKV